jgi:hypothetical protein
MQLDQQEYDDLGAVHVFDWLEQVPRSSFGWGHRRAEYRKMAERAGREAIQVYDRVFSQEPVRQ